MHIDFPSSFLWGAALSSYQTEGANFNSDWCLWENKKKLEPAGHASDHYRLFQKDFELAKELHLNCLRISPEWSRVCPRYHTYDERELEHYRAVIESLTKLNIKPIVTLHHFTNPIWFSERGGWLSAKNVDSFLHYLRTVVKLLKDKVEYWLIINEPLVYIYNSFILGIWPPGHKSLISAQKVLRNIIHAYILGYREIKALYGGTGVYPKISFSKHLRLFYPCPKLNIGLNNICANLRDKMFNWQLLEYLHQKNFIDYIAINYYCKEYVKFKWHLGVACNHTDHSEHKNYLNWYIYPKGLYDCLIKLKKYNLPIIVTENGTAETDNPAYEEYLTSHILNVGNAISQGVDVRGYLWWSLIDNFEWHEGFNPRFGLAEVNYRDFSRKIRPFALTYAKICKENKLTI
jgi:beta-glucosidase